MNKIAKIINNSKAVNLVWKILATEMNHVCQIQGFKQWLNHSQKFAHLFWKVFLLKIIKNSLISISEKKIFERSFTYKIVFEAKGFLRDFQENNVISIEWTAPQWFASTFHVVTQEGSCMLEDYIRIQCISVQSYDYRGT